ncbi:MAG: translation initiation factor IF-5A, partial [Methanomicrobiales archaeon]|nr:translation initiation factor IF-5A [Methanomicrobiales archaeon]
AKIYVPMVERKGAQVISKAGRVIQLMDTKDFTMFELTVSEEDAARIETGTDITYIESMGKRKLD